jgi:glycosyltransferase involved in cell wall biosynthesis
MGSVSIAMATLNGARYVGVQLESIAAQSRLPDELIVCDDGSSDATLAVISRFARNAPFPVRIVQNKKRLGYRENFMRAAGLCSGELISFSDQDDVWHHQKIERMVAAFEDPDVLLAFHNATVVDARRAPVGQTFARSAGAIYSALELPPWTVVPGFSQMFHRSLLRYSDLHDRSVDVYSATERMPHDQWFVFLASVFGSVAYLPGRLAQYRQHRTNCSGWLPSRPLSYAVHSVTHARRYAVSASAAVASRLSLLDELRDRSDDADKIRAAIDHYLAVKRYTDLRLQIYASKSLKRRARSIASLIKDRAYTQARASFGLDNLVLDMCIGMSVGPVLRA